jgi:hypothetical protein
MTTRIAIVAAAFMLNACATAGSSDPATATLRHGDRAVITLASNDGRYELRIGSAAFAGEFFGDEGDKPAKRVVQLDHSRQVVLLSVPDPVDCRYRVYGDAGGATLQLTELISEHCRSEPRFDGDGTIRVTVWEGFWSRPVVYVRQRDGTFAPSLDRYFPVGLSARAERTTSAEGLVIPAGANVRVTQYDLTLQRYEVETGGERGWINAEGLSDLLPSLPWAE